jgi:hypothetical protein
VNEIASGSAYLLLRRPGSIGSPPMHFHPPSIDPGVMAFVWALLLAVYIYFGLLAVGASGAFSIVIGMLAFAGIWLFVRLRGEDRPGV